MTLFIQIHFISLASLCCVQMQMFRSSFFKISSQENLVEDENFAIATQVHDEFSCALMCSSKAVCHYALFDKDSKKCSFVQAREKRNPLDSEESDSRKVILEKVSRHECIKSEQMHVVCLPLQRLLKTKSE